jgi:hypothetical protein
MTKFLPSNFDLVDYDYDLLKKQLQLEIVKITLDKDDEKAQELEVPLYYRRSVERSSNEEGMFNRLQ